MLQQHEGTNLVPNKHQDSDQAISNNKKKFHSDGVFFRIFKNKSWKPAFKKKDKKSQGSKAPKSWPRPVVPYAWCTLSPPQMSKGNWTLQNKWWKDCPNLTRKWLMSDKTKRTCQMVRIEIKNITKGAWSMSCMDVYNRSNGKPRLNMSLSI